MMGPPLTSVVAKAPLHGDRIGDVAFGLGPSPGPASHLCASLSAEIVALNARIERMWASLGDALGSNNAQSLRGVWRAARMACSALVASDPCQALWDSWQASPLEGPGVALRNAIWHVWNECTLSSSRFAAASGPGGFLCYLLRENARRAERGFVARAGVTPPYNYERDVEPLEDTLKSLQQMLVQCIGSGRLEPSRDPQHPGRCNQCSVDHPDNWLDCWGCCNDCCGAKDGRCYDTCSMRCPAPPT